MKFSNGRLIYDGIHVTLDGRAAFMEEALRYDAVQKGMGGQNLLLQENVGDNRRFCYYASEGSCRQQLL